MGKNKKEWLKGFGFSSIMAFLRKGKERDKIINASGEEKVVFSPTNLKANALHPKQLKGRIISKKPCGDKAIRYLVSCQNLPYFRAGQYVNVMIQDGNSILSRPISISCAPSSGLLELIIGINEKGYFAKKAHELFVPDGQMVFSGPTGEFYYSPNRDERHVIACCGGIGITPILSMAKAIAYGDEDFRLTIFHGVKNEKDAAFAEDFQEIAARTDKVSYRVYDESKLEMIKEEDIRKAASNEPFSLFVCGPQGMYMAFDKIASNLNLDNRHYRKEIFGSIKDIRAIHGYPGTKEETYKIIVHMVDKVFNLEAKADEPLLYALERSGIATPNRCRGGLCGYCRGRILKGEVYIPPIGDGRREADKKKGYAHLCMTYPLSEIELEIPAP